MRHRRIAGQGRELVGRDLEHRSARQSLRDPQAVPRRHILDGRRVTVDDHPHRFRPARLQLLFEIRWQLRAMAGGLRGCVAQDEETGTEGDAAEESERGARAKCVGHGVDGR